MTPTEQARADRDEWALDVLLSAASRAKDDPQWQSILNEVRRYLRTRLADHPAPPVSEGAVEAAMSAYYAAFQCGKETSVYYDEETRRNAMRAALTAAGLFALRARVVELEAANEGLRGVIHDEIAANMKLREDGGALPDEDMPTFCERVLRERSAAESERDALRREVEGLKSCARDWAQAYHYVTDILPLDERNLCRDPASPLNLAEQDRHRVDVLIGTADTLRQQLAAAEQRVGAVEANPPSAVPQLRYVVLKASGSRYAYVQDTHGPSTVKRYDIFKGDGWTKANKHAAHLNAQDAARQRQEGTPDT